MQFGIVGLGPRGAGTARQLMRGGHRCVAYDRDPERVSRLALQGAVRARSIAELAGNLQPPRVVLLMLPAREPTADALLQLAEDFKDGDITVDAGNACYQDDLLRRDRLGEPALTTWIAECPAGSCWEGVKKRSTISLPSCTLWRPVNAQAAFTADRAAPDTS